MIIDPKLLAKPTLDSLIEEFVTRDGTDYGAEEYSLEQKKRQILTQLERGDIFLTFDQETESCAFLSKEEARSL